MSRSPGRAKIPSSVDPVSDSDTFRLALPEPGGTASSENRRQMELATSALSGKLRPVVRPCNLVLGESIFSQPLLVSSLASEQRRALDSVDEILSAELLIERDEIKIEPEELEFAEFEEPSGPGLGGDVSAASPVRPARAAVYDCGDDSPDYHPSMDEGRGGRRRSGRPRVPTWRALLSRESARASRGGRRARGRASSGLYRGRRAVPVSSPPASTVTAPAPSQASTVIPILTIAEKKIAVKLLSGRLAIQASYDSNDKPVELSEQELTFMQLVQVKDNISRLMTTLPAGLGAEGAGSSGGAELMQRLRAARSLALSWIEARLRADPSLKTPGSVGADGELQPESDTNSADENPTFDDAIAPADSNNTAPVLPSIAEKKTARVTDVLDKRSFKNSQDLAALQTKLHDISAVESELRRAVEFFGGECEKDETRLKRLGIELALLKQRCHGLEAHLEKNRHKVAFVLLDKNRRRQLSADDTPVQACADLLTEVGHELYVELLSLPLPLLTPKELQDRSRGKNTPWLDRRLLRAASRSVKHHKRVNSGALAASSAQTTTQTTDVAHERQQVCQLISPAAEHQRQMTSADDRVTPDVGEEVSSYIESGGEVGGSDQITLPPEVLEQVMQGKGYLVDENGERLEIRVLPDGNVIAGAQNVA